jgi:hypothetical protein
VTANDEIVVHDISSSSQSLCKGTHRKTEVRIVREKVYNALKALTSGIPLYIIIDAKESLDILLGYFIDLLVLDFYEGRLVQKSVPLSPGPGDFLTTHALTGEVCNIEMLPEASKNARPDCVRRHPSFSDPETNAPFLFFLASRSDDLILSMSI